MRMAPSAPKSTPPPRRDLGSGPRRERGTGTRVRPRVLIVDDTEDTRELYAWCMRAAGWQVEATANGAEALMVAPVFEPDVIVMDLRMPVLDGFAAIRRLKLEEETKHVPIVACTAFDLPVSEAEARAAGCDEFVAKPCEPDALRALLETVLRDRSSQPH